MAGSKWKVAYGRLQVAGGRWQVAGSRWQVEARSWKGAGGSWQVTGRRCLPALSFQYKKKTVFAWLKGGKHSREKSSIQALKS